jgi:hypothetical protein
MRGAKEALQDLKEWGKIEIGKDRLVSITAAGLSELETVPEMTHKRGQHHS